MLSSIIHKTDNFIASVPKLKRKKYGQFFTNMATANFMASLFCFDLTKPELHLLDAGAGTGILSAAVIDKLIQCGYKGRIYLTCYETDDLVLPLLKSNLDLAKEEYGISYEIIQDNYLTSQLFENNSLFSDNMKLYDYIKRSKGSESDAKCLLWCTKLVFPILGYGYS